jgi:hypothetical protein
MNESTAIHATREAMNQLRVAFTVDCVIFGYGEEKLKILLVECNLPPYIGKWSLLGDFMRDDENLDHAAHRVLKHYTYLESIHLEQVATYGAKGRHPLGRVVTAAYYSLMKVQNFEDMVSDGLRVQWFDIDELPRLAFDHGKILSSCHTRLQKRLRERPIGFGLLPQKFTLSQLRKLYEVVLGIELDKRNFRRKLKSLNLLINTETVQSDVAHRPATLFSFDHELYERQMSAGLHFEL